jgi:hypothetical protein
MRRVRLLARMFLERYGINTEGEESHGGDVAVSLIAYGHRVTRHDER